MLFTRQGVNKEFRAERTERELVDKDKPPDSEERPLKSLAVLYSITALSTVAMSALHKMPDTAQYLALLF